MKLRSKLAIATFAAVLSASAAAEAQDPTFFRIGTGSAGGTYFPIGGTIANGISSPPGSRPCDQGGQCGVPGLIAIAQSTTASVFNNAAVQNGELEMGMAAADVTRSMFLGEGKFEGKPHEKLRIIANLFPEDLHLVLPKGKTINNLGDLEGKRVGIAQAGSGTQVAVLQMLEAWGITRDNIEEAELNNSQSAERLADGQLDAYFYAAGWPVAAMVQLASTKGDEPALLYRGGPAKDQRDHSGLHSLENSGRRLRRCRSRFPDPSRQRAVGGLGRSTGGTDLRHHQSPME